MKTLKTVMVSGVLAVIIAGCGGGNTNQSATPSSGSLSTKYMAFSPGVYNNDEIWKTDGTVAGTALIDNSMKINNSSQDITLTITALFKVGNKLVSSVRYVDDSGGGILPTGYEKLYKTDPNIQNSGTVIANSSSNLIFGAIGLKEFKSSTGEQFIVKGSNLYKLNASTFSLTQVNPNNIQIRHIFGYFQDGDNLYFNAKNSNINADGLWKINLLSSNPSANLINTNVNKLTIFPIVNGNNLYAFIGDNAKGFDKYDSSIPDFTQLTASISPAYSNYAYTKKSSIPYVNFGSDTYFMAGVSNNNIKLYKANSNNSTPITLSNTFDPLTRTMFKYQNKIFIYNDDKLVSYSPSNGSSSVVATNLVNYGYGGSLYLANNKIYFAKNDATYGVELWEYDGSNLARVTDINSGTGNSNPTRVTEVNGDIVFQATPDGTNNHLYKWDGTTVTLLN